jgi:CheY-like chemotaxis protein
MLLKLGYQVVAANDGEEAIALLSEKNTTVDLILMDQSMPKKDGVTATKEIRDMEGASKLPGRTPIIAVTAVVNPQAQGAFLEAGADDFLAKPLSLDKLKDTLAMYLS